MANAAAAFSVHPFAGQPPIREGRVSIRYGHVYRGQFIRVYVRVISTEIFVPLGRTGRQDKAEELHSHWFPEGVGRGIYFLPTSKVGARV